MWWYWYYLWYYLLATTVTNRTKESVIKTSNSTCWFSIYLTSFKPKYPKAQPKITPPITSVANNILIPSGVTLSTPNNFTHNAWVSDDGSTVFTTDEVSGAYIAAVDVSDISDMTVIDQIQSWSSETNVIPQRFIYPSTEESSNSNFPGYTDQFVPTPIYR